MGLFFNKKNDSMKDQLRRNVQANLSSCRTCRFYDKNREVCLNRNSGVTYTNASQPKCSCWQLS